MIGEDEAEMEKGGREEGYDQVVQVDGEVARLHLKACDHVCPQGKAEDEEDPTGGCIGFDQIDDYAKGIDGQTPKEGDQKYQEEILERKRYGRDGNLTELAPRFNEVMDPRSGCFVPEY